MGLVTGRGISSGSRNGRPHASCTAATATSQRTVFKVGPQAVNAAAVTIADRSTAGTVWARKTRPSALPTTIASVSLNRPTRPAISQTEPKNSGQVSAGVKVQGVYPAEASPGITTLSYRTNTDVAAAAGHAPNSRRFIR